MSIVSFENLPPTEKQIFKRLNPGSHNARILEIVEVEKDYLKANGGSGKGINLIYETFGNTEDKFQNGKKIFQTLPLDGEYHKIAKAVLFAIFPEQNAPTFDLEAAKGRYVEIILKYNQDKETGQDRKYPNVIKVLPYVGTVPNLESLAPEDYNLSDVPF